MGYISVLLIIKVCEILAGYILMLCQVIICSVSDSPELTPSEWEKEFHICGSLAVEAQLFLIMVTVTNLIILKSESTQPVKAELLPVCKPLRSVSGSQKNSSSICSNSRVRNVKLPGVISLRKDLPI